MTSSNPQHHGPNVGKHPEDATAAAQAPARVVLLDNRDSFVYNLVDQFATLGSQIQVYRNNVPASRVLTALEPTAAEREARSARSTAAPTASRSLRRAARMRPSRFSTADRWTWPAITPWAHARCPRRLSAWPVPHRWTTAEAAAS